jgi:histidyl-tRNA synthetase
MLDDAGVEWELDTTLVRGLDYYTRTVFEFESPDLGAQSGVGGGGRYDRLVEQLGGPPTPACGWAAGIERMLLAAEPMEDRVEVDLFVAYAKPQYAREALRLATAARRGGLHAEVELAGRSLKGQLKQADRVGARYVALLGDEGAQLKDMQSGEQHAIDPDAVADAVRRERPVA